MLILLISSSRLILQVHYVRDVLAGVALGAVLIAVSRWLAGTESTPRVDRVFLCAGLVSVVGLGVGLAGGHTEEVRHAAIGVGTAAGGATTWYQLGDQLTAAPAVSLPIGGGGLAVAGGIWIGAYRGSFGLAGALVGSAVGVVIIFVLPLIERWLKKDRNAVAD